MLSFDGTCGDKSYGSELPEFLGLKKILVMKEIFEKFFLKEMTSGGLDPTS